MPDPSGDAAFRHLEELVASAEKPVKKRAGKPRAPEQKWRDHMTPEKIKRRRMKAANDWTKQIEWKRKRSLTPNGRPGVAKDPVLFSINQAIHYAGRGVVTREIVSDCLEPMRSRLQALIDGIKADPCAGIPVMTLLQGMRAVRKLELAEQQLQSETLTNHHEEEDPT